MGLTGSFKGFESIYAAIRMFYQMVLKIIGALLVCHIVIVSLILYFNSDKVIGKIDSVDRCLIKTYYYSKVRYNLTMVKDRLMVLYPCEGRNVEMSYASFMNTFSKYVEHRVGVLREKILMLFLWTSFIYLLFPFLLIQFALKHKKDTQDKFIRGAKFIDPVSFREIMEEKTNKGISFRISENVSMPMGITSRHTFIIGKPGTGKTQLIGRILDQILKNNFRIIIHDFKGDFISSYFDPERHYIFNPLDKRHMGLKDFEMKLIVKMNEVRVGDLNQGIREKYLNKLGEINENKKIEDCFSYPELLENIKELHENISENSKFHAMNIADLSSERAPTGWSIFNELSSSVDIDAFCASLIPESASQDNFWPISSRQLLGSIIMYCIFNKKKTYGDLWNLVNRSNEELLELFKTTPGCEEGMKLLTEAKTANNILAVLSNYTKPIKYLRGTDGDFSIKAWVRDADSKKRVIFLSNYAMIQETIRPFLTLFVDFSTKTLCSMDDDLDRRLFFILDEFGQLSKIGSIIQLLTQSRSKGGATYILIQDVAQISSIYGKDGSTSIVNSCGNTISFAVSDEATADFISKKIGSMEIKRSEESKSMGVEDMKDSISISKQTTEKRIVMPSEIMNIPTMNCYIQLTDYPVTRDRLDFMKFPKRCESYIGREDLLFASEEVKPGISEEIKTQDHSLNTVGIQVTTKEDEFFGEIKAVVKNSEETPLKSSALIGEPEKAPAGNLQVEDFGEVI